MSHKLSTRGEHDGEQQPSRKTRSLTETPVLDLGMGESRRSARW